MIVMGGLSQDIMLWSLLGKHGTKQQSLYLTHYECGGAVSNDINTAGKSRKQRFEADSLMCYMRHVP